MCRLFGVFVGFFAAALLAVSTGCHDIDPTEETLPGACIDWPDHPWNLCLDDYYLYECPGGPDGEIVDICENGCAWEDIIGPTGGTVFAYCVPDSD